MAIERIAIPKTLRDAASSFLESVRNFVGDIVKLAKLEARLALASFVIIAICGAAVALLALTAWILLIASLVAWITQNWLGLPAALLVVAVVMIIAAVPPVLLVRRYKDNFSFKATKRQLRGIKNVGKH